LVVDSRVLPRRRGAAASAGFRAPGALQRRLKRFRVVDWSVAPLQGLPRHRRPPSLEIWTQSPVGPVIAGRDRRSSIEEQSGLCLAGHLS